MTKRQPASESTEHALSMTLIACKFLLSWSSIFARVRRVPSVVPGTAHSLQTEEKECMLAWGVADYYVLEINDGQRMKEGLRA